MNRGGSIDGAMERSIVEKSRDPFFRRTPERERRDQTLYCSNTCLLRRASPTADASVNSDFSFSLITNYAKTLYLEPPLMVV